MSIKPKWKRTSVQNLLKDANSGMFYGRWTVSGKQIWKALKTDKFSVAKLRLSTATDTIEKKRTSVVNVNRGECTVGELMDHYLKYIDANTDITDSTKKSSKGAVLKIKKTWPNIESLMANQVTTNAVFTWSQRFKNEGTQFTPPNAKSALKGNSASSVNRAVSALAKILDLGVEVGVIHVNPVRVKHSGGSFKKKLKKHVLSLASKEDVKRVINGIENNGARGGWGIEAADFCRFLMFTGCRVGEVKTVSWSSINWDKRELHIKGYKSLSSDRLVPLFKDLEELLKKIIERRKHASLFTQDGKVFLEPSDPIFRISECQKSITSSCANQNIARITHHAFRHIFITTCIESGVDIPTISRWVGHSDGGALLMKTYGHLRNEHSQAAALKVKF